MVQCAKCGMQNVDGGKFCRFCGAAILQTSAGGGDTRRPYSWQSEEYPALDRTQDLPSQQTQVLPNPRPQYHQQPQYQQRPQQQQQTPPRTLHQQPQNAQPMAVFGQPQYPQQHYGHLYCNHCRMQVIPNMQRQISQAGWIVFAILLVTTVFFFWIGLLIREDATLCPNCKRRIY